MLKKLMWLALGTIIAAACNEAPIKENKMHHRMTTSLVPDQETAKKIAEAIWVPLYGSSVLDQKPYSINLISDSIWIVEGKMPENMIGGVAYIEIAKADCKIIKVSHGK